MVARTEAGKIIARGEFSQVTQGDEVSMRLTYHFQDGSVDDESTTYSQRDRFRLVRYHHLQKGPFFVKPVDYSIDAASGHGTVTIRSTDMDGKPNIESSHIDLPDDVTNGFVGTLLINVPPNVAPFRVRILAPDRPGAIDSYPDLAGGRTAVRMAGQTLKATASASIRSWAVSWAGLRRCSAYSRRM